MKKILFLTTDNLEKIQRGIPQQARYLKSIGYEVKITITNQKIDPEIATSHGLEVNNFVSINSGYPDTRLLWNRRRLDISAYFLFHDILNIISGKLQLRGVMQWKSWLLSAFAAKRIAPGRYNSSIIEVLKSENPEIIVSSNFLLGELLYVGVNITSKIVWHAAEFASAKRIIGSRSTRLVQSLEKLMSKNSSLILVDNDALVSAMSEYFKLPPNKFCIISNTPDTLNDKTPETSLRARFLIPKEDCLILYHGHLVAGRYLTELANFVSSSTLNRLHVVFLGSGNLYNELWQIANTNSNVHIESYFSNYFIGSYVQESDYLFAVYDAKDQNNQLGGPNKVYDAITYGTKLIVNQNCAYVSSLVSRNQLGVCLEPDSASSWGALHFLLASNDKRKNEKMESLLWDAQEKKLLNAFSHLL
jgi:hypothetical protein